MGLPEINIIFKKLAADLIQRSERGIACLVLKDGTKDPDIRTYKLVTEVNEEDYTEENIKLIKECFLPAPRKVIVITIGAEATFSDAANSLNGATFNWMCYPYAGEQDDVVSWLKGKNNINKARKIKAVVYKPTTAPDDAHIVDFATETIKKKGEESTVTGDKYLPRLVGILSTLPLNRSATYYELTDIEYVVEPENPSAEIDKGKLIIINDDGAPKIGSGVTSLTTTSETTPVDFKKIIIVESADMIQEDIYSTFKKYYVGKYKNKYSNQALFIGAVIGYFKELVREDVLDNEYENTCDVNVEKQRDELISLGKTEAVDWDDYKVKKNTIGNKLMLQGKIKITDAMEDLELIINMD